MSLTRKIVLTALGGTVAATFALAQGSDFKRELGARQSLMQLYAFNLGPLGAMAQGKMDYNAEVAATAAANLAALSKLNGSAMWPAGSDNASVENTRALPALWENFPDVGAKAAALTEAADAMAAAAGTDLASLQAAMGPLGGACGACHKAYRAEE